MPEVLFLIDGHALAYRTYFALTAGSGGGRWVTSTGEPTAGIYGFTRVLMKILEQENPDYIAVAFDTGKTFRDDIYPEYKGTRAKMPEDLRPQIERIRELVDAFNIPRLELEGYEADDVLGSVSKKAVEDGMGVKIFTGDRDLLQLVDDRLIVTLPGKSLSEAKDYLPKDVIEYFGVRPDQIVDYKALVGDPSDNIPGVRGVGAKTAVKLLGEYQTLESVYEHLDEMKPSLRKKLEASRDSAFLSQRLARIVTDLVIPLDLDKARPQQFNPEHVRKLFRTLEFRSLLNRLTALEVLYGKRPQSGGEQLSMFPVVKLSATRTATVSRDGVKIDACLVNTPKALAQLVETLNDSRIIAFDTETTSTDKMRAKLVGISLAVDETKGYYIPVGHHQTGEPQLPLSQVIDALKAPLTNPKIEKAGHNLKYDYVVLHRHGLDVFPLSFDTMIAEWLTNPASRNLGLKNLVWVRLGIQMTTIVELIGKGKKQISMADVPIGKVLPYAVDDAVMVLRLLPELQLELEKTEERHLFDEMEMPLIRVLAGMEMAGICLDVPFLDRMSATLGKRMKVIEEEIYSQVGKVFNINSTQQLSQILFDKLGLKPPGRTRKTASGHYSTAASVLELMRGAHPVVDNILEYRELAKLQSTYVDSLPLQVNPETHRIHTSYHQAGSVTGRIASSDPNLQNIPIRTDLGREVRKAFVAEAGNQLLAADYSQVELRIAAHMAQDKAMIQAFREGQDIHAATAAAIYHVPIDDVTRGQRRHAKAINFGLLYGMSPFGLTRSTDLTLAEAEDFVERYFEQFPGIKSFIDQMRKSVAEKGYVETLLGRRRYFPVFSSEMNRNAKNRAEREAINAPIQGTAADIIKLAMLDMQEKISKSGFGAKMLLQVHDELVFEVPEDEIEATAKLVKSVMEGIYKLDVPLKTDLSVGKNWGELKTFDL